VGECSFWYRPTRVVPDQRPLNMCVCARVRTHVRVRCFDKVDIDGFSFLGGEGHRQCYVDGAVNLY